MSILGNNNVVNSFTHAATSKATPVDSDEISITDSSTGFELKKFTWGNLKERIKEHIDSFASRTAYTSGVVDANPTTYTDPLAAISKSLHSGVIVDNFLYDTSKDSDGGEWRKCCQDKGWYTENLGGTAWLGQQLHEDSARAAAATKIGSELISNTAFEVNTTGWTAVNNGVISQPNLGAMVITPAAQIWSGATTSITTIIGRTYVASVDVTCAGWVSLSAENTAGSGTKLANITTSGCNDKKLAIKFVATATTTYIGIENSNTTNTTAITVDNITTKEVDIAIPVTGAYYQNTTNGNFYTLLAGSGQTVIYRGNTREFPATSAIIAETGRVIIYDLTRAGNPMWMVFIIPVCGDSMSTSGAISAASAGLYISSLHALNGSLFVGRYADGSSVRGLNDINFIRDMTRFYGRFGGGANGFSINGSIAARNSLSPTTPRLDYQIIHGVILDISATVLPNAPIDITTNLPTTTVAVATDGGVSVIKDDGNIWDLTTTNGNYTYARYVGFTARNRLQMVFSWQGGVDYGLLHIVDLPTADLAFVYSSPVSALNGEFYRYTASPAIMTEPLASADKSWYSWVPSKAVGGLSGISLFKTNPAVQAKGMVAYISSTYNSGWMPGDIRGAWLADTSTMTITGSTELVTNGKFNTDIVGWASTGAGSAAWVSGEAQVTYVSGTEQTLTQTISTVVDKSYTVKASCRRGTSAGAQVFIGSTLLVDTAVVIDVSGVTTYGTKTFIAKNTTTNIWCRVYSAGTSYFDNISITQLLVTNGEFTTDTTGWTGSGGSVVGGELQLTATADFTESMAQSVTVVVGKTYTFYVTHRMGTSTLSRIQLTGASGTVNFTNITGTNRTDKVTFTATTTTLGIALYGSSGTSYFDNISLVVSEDDRSLKDNPLTISPGGSITKAIVNTGAQLVAYSGFSADSYLEQSYNADLDFGTGDFCVMGWINQASISSNMQSIVDRSDPSSSTPRWRFYTSATNNYLGLSLVTAGASFNLNTSQVLPTGSWGFVIGCRRGTTAELWINGVLRASSAVLGETLTNSIGKLIIGNNAVDYSSPVQGSLSLIRISAYAPSADQIQYIYENEKKLFEVNTQCCIDGTSSRVEALSFDESSDILHAGTSWGRSSFKGLTRVESKSVVTGSIVSVSSNNGSYLVGGSTSSFYYRPATTLQEELYRSVEDKKALRKELVGHEFTASSNQTTFVLPLSWEVKSVYVSGTLKRIVADYTISFDGFRNSVILGTGVATSTPVTIFATRT